MKLDELKQVEDLAAGTELDEAIAKLMGYERVTDRSFAPKGKATYIVRQHPKEEDTTPYIVVAPASDQSRLYCRWQPSQDIELIFSLIDEHKYACSLESSNYNHGQHLAFVYTMDGRYEQEAATRAEALARAFYQAHRMGLVLEAQGFASVEGE